MDGHHWLVQMPVKYKPYWPKYIGGKEHRFGIDSGEYDTWLSRRILIAPEHVDYFMGKEWPEGSFARSCNNTAPCDCDGRKPCKMPKAEPTTFQRPDPGEGKKEESGYPDQFKWLEKEMNDFKNYLKGLLESPWSPVAASQEGQEELWDEVKDIFTKFRKFGEDIPWYIENELKQHFEIKRKP